MKHVGLKLRLSVGLLVGAIVSTTLLSSVSAASPGTAGPWATSPNVLPQTITGTASATYNNYVYNVGGTDGGDSNQVAYAPLNPDGSVGSWTASPNTLPQNLYRPEAVTFGGYLYVIGGENSLIQDTVYSAPLNPDGSVGSWTASPNTLPQPRADTTSVVNNGYVYILGGYGGSPTDTVYYAQLQANGAIGPWATSPNNLPVGTYYPSSAVNNNYIYYFGGDSGSGIVDTIYYTRVNSDGSIDPWVTSSTNLPEILETASAEAYNGYVFLMGGFGTGVSHNTVYVARFNSDGTLGAWSLSPNSLPDSISNSSSVMHNGFAYLLGGGDADGFINSVFYAPLTGSLPVVSASSPATAPNTGFGAPAQNTLLSAVAFIGTLSLAIGLRTLIRHRSNTSQHI